MARLKTFASSSSGNCTYIGASDQGVLVDCGISCRGIVNSLKDMDCDPNHIKAVLITHEHIDHIKGLKLFLTRSEACVCATKEVLNYLIDCGHVPCNTKLVEVGETPFQIGNMEIEAFPTPHDSVGSVGYTIHTQDDHKIAIATDMGIVTQEIIVGLKGCETVLLESNYDPELLRMSSYPQFLKSRITSDLGHLPNHESAKLASLLLETGTVRLVLAHLSKQNNSPSLAYQTVKDVLLDNGAVENEDYLLSVAPYDRAGQLISF